MPNAPIYDIICFN